MNDEVRITANGRCEMRVGFGREREMALVALAVAGLFQRTEHEVTENPLLRFAGNFRNQPLVVSRGNAKIIARQDYVLPRFTSIPAFLGDRKSLDGNRADT